jgi:hypothetical protein
MEGCFESPEAAAEPIPRLRPSAFLLAYIAGLARDSVSGIDQFNFEILDAGKRRMKTSQQVEGNRARAPKTPASFALKKRKVPPPYSHAGNGACSLNGCRDDESLVGTNGVVNSYVSKAAFSVVPIEQRSRFLCRTTTLSFK